MNTNLRILLDEAITNPLAEMIKGCSSAINVEYIRDIESMKSTSDEGVVSYATRQDRIVVTTETGINHKKFKICTHPGIIVLCGPRHETIHAEVFQKFLLSGERVKAKHAVTFISQKEARIKTANSFVDEVVRL